MLSWPTLHIFQPLHSRSEYQENQKLPGNCSCTSAYAQSMSQQIIGLLPTTQLPTQNLNRRFGMLGPCLSYPPSTNTAHKQHTHKVAAISPLTSVHALGQHPLAYALHTASDTHHHGSLTLPCTQATKPTHKQLAIKPPLPCTSLKG